jgi:hypothetical protein
MKGTWRSKRKTALLQLPRRTLWFSIGTSAIRVDLPVALDAVQCAQDCAIKAIKLYTHERATSSVTVENQEGVNA